MDLAIFNQTLFTSCNGGDLYNSIQQNHYFSDHFAPFLHVIRPLYCLVPSPLTLLVLQSFALALGALPVFFLSRAVFKRKCNDSDRRLNNCN